ncbi:citrate transporter family protein [Mycobacterium xenopi 3993]|nr:citrate transporter family protein [Mycobacterium xenopi 3993]
MSAVAVAVFVVAYALIASDRIDKTVVALAGAAVVVTLPVINSADIFYSHRTGIDWDVIFLLLGMMVIVSVLRQTGVFEYVAIWSAKRAKGSPLRIMILLALVMAVGSALLDNVTTVLLIAPVTLLVCDRLAINAAPFLIAEVFASNIGGAATLVGDPPNIIIASRAGLTFNDFLLHMAPIVLIVMVVFVALLPRLFAGSFDVDAQRVADVMSLDEGRPSATEDCW